MAMAGDYDWLPQALKNAGVTQAALAAFMGADKTVISKIIAGVRGVKAHEDKAIRAFLALKGRGSLAETAPAPHDDIDPDFLRKQAQAIAIRAALAGGGDVVQAGAVGLDVAAYYIRNAHMPSETDLQAAIMAALAAASRAGDAGRDEF